MGDKVARRLGEGEGEMIIGMIVGCGMRWDSGERVRKRSCVLVSLEELRPHLWRSGVGVVQPLHGHGQDAVRIAGADAAHVGVPVELHGPFVMT